jgi:type II secretory ATPase GspE/PulE/Tfp pilus assembly ATPase PilB-like protein
MADRQKEESFHDITTIIDDLLARGLAAGATDLHFEPIDEGMLVRIRVDGQLADLEVFSCRLSENLVARLKILASLLTYRVDIPQEGGFLWQSDAREPGDFRAELRVATFPTIRGERAVVRVFRATPALQSLDSLGFATDQVARLREAIAQPTGLIVVSGPAGSGKTTTLYAMIRELRDQSPGRSVITLEDPVEQRLNRVAQIQINPHGELGYERCMRSVLRHDPQVILLGEVRDRQTAAVAIEAALTGHLILTTVHSGDAAETMVRFLEMGIPSYQLTSALTVVCSQRLLRMRCARCHGSMTRGCEACLMTGYAGRTAIAQLAELDERVRALVLDHSSASALRVELTRQGPGLIERAKALSAGGVTDEDELARVLGCIPFHFYKEEHLVA